MTHPADDLPSPALARLTGGLYLIIIVCGLFGEAWVRASLVVPGDASTTATRIMASPGLFRLGLVSDLVAFLADVGVAVLLYVLLKPVNRTVALGAAAFRLTGTAIYGVNLLNYFAPLLVLSGADALSAFEPDQLQTISLLFLEIHGLGYDLGLVFFGASCLLLGYLLYHSAHFSKLVGILMGLAFAGYWVGSFTRFLAPQYVDSVAPVYAGPLLGELALCLWLLIVAPRRMATA